MAPSGPHLSEDPGIWWLNLGRRLSGLSEEETYEDRMPVIAEPGSDSKDIMLLRWLQVTRGRDAYLVDPPAGMAADVAERIRRGKATEDDMAVWRRLQPSSRVRDDYDV